MKFSLQFSDKKEITFSTDTNGLIINRSEYIASDDGVLIYDKTKGLKSDNIICQFSTNTSTLIPALKILKLPYHPYFDERPTINSQNDITFYWKPSKLAAFYNRFGVDALPYTERKPIIRRAVRFLIATGNKGANFLKEEMLNKINEPCELLGFYQGFPIFNGEKGMPKLLSRLGIHIGIENIVVSTPMDKYANDVEELTRDLEKEAGPRAMRKKNRTIFPKNKKVLSTLHIVI